MGDLKPCPFCGSDLVGHWAQNSCIVCHHCGAEGPVLEGHALSHLSSSAAWNTRATPPEVTALVEARVVELEALSAKNARPAWLANCCICGRVVDTREVSEGGDQHGCQYDGGWVCSSDCGCRLLGDPTEAEEHAAREAESRAAGMREAAEMLDNPRLWGCGHPLSRLVSAILERAEEIEKEARNG